MRDGLSLKYMPLVFEDAVGQDVPVRYLSTLIQKGQVGKNIILAGQTGSGKTTLARIYARALNCANPTESGSPCNECASCKAHIEGRYSDYAEYDAASHSKVDQIREFIQVAGSPPMFGAFRVLLLDEAHALSKQAWDSLLKVVEEPPPYLVFLFATTEPLKIREAIRGRCQTLTVSVLDEVGSVAHLKGVCSKEGLSYEDAALRMLTYLSKGHPRNLLNNLEKVTYLSDVIDLESVMGAFQIADVLIPVQALKGMVEGKHTKVSQTLASWTNPPGKKADDLKATLLITYYRHHLREEVDVSGFAHMIPFGDTQKLHDSIEELSANQKASITATYSWLLAELNDLRFNTDLALFSGMASISLKAGLKEFGNRGEAVASDGIEVDDASKKKQLKRRIGRRFVQSHTHSMVASSEPVPEQNQVQKTEPQNSGNVIPKQPHINPYSDDSEVSLDELENSFCAQTKSKQDLEDFGFSQSSLESLE